MKTWLFRFPTQDDLSQVLQAWRIWLLAIVVGALLGSMLYFIFPPAYRAQASVVVDQNLEQAWTTTNSERDVMTYLARETQKLVEVAWADATLQMVVDQNPGTSIASLRTGKLQLSQTADGAWHFWADDAVGQNASRLASSWAKAFYERSLEGIRIANQIQVLQAALLINPSDPGLIKTQVDALEPASLGISSYLQISLSQSEQIPVTRKTSLALAILAGAAGGWTLTLLGLLFLAPKNKIRGNE